jgi:energy-coupling factor transporter transmembrane protein EcfT
MGVAVAVIIAVMALVAIVGSIVTATTTGNELGRSLESRSGPDWRVRWDRPPASPDGQ